MYYILIEGIRSIDVLALNELKNANISKLIFQTYFQFADQKRKIYILDKPHYEVKNFGNKPIYDISKSSYISMRNDMKQKIMRNNIVR